MHKFRKAVLYIILLLIAFIMLMPFYMMFVMSTLSTDQIYSFPPIMWFGSNQFCQYARADQYSAGIWEQLYCFNILHRIMSAFLFNGRLCFCNVRFSGQRQIIWAFACNDDDPFHGRHYTMVYDDVQNALAQFLLGTDHSGMCKCIRYILDETVLSE